MQIDINRIHADFWATRNKKIKALLAKPHLASIMERREVEKARMVRLSPSEAVRIERIRNQTCFEAELESAHAEYAQLPIMKAQQRRARKPRGRFTDDEMTMGQVVEGLIAKAEYRSLSARELWPFLHSELAASGHEPKEINSAILKRSSYSYEFKDGTKTISFGRFANLVSQLRRASR